MNDLFVAADNASPRRSALGATLIVLVTFAVYWPALRGEFVWDDLVLVKKNPLLTGEHSLSSIWFQGDFPLATVGFWIQHLLWGENPTGYHAVNIALHAVNALFVWRVLARLKVCGAWLAAMIFVVHPVCVASAAWISELKNTLSLVFFLLSFLWYLRFEDQRTEVRGPGAEVNPPTSSYYWLSLGAFLLALLSKTSTVMLPVVLLAGAWWRRGRVTKSDWLAATPHFALAIAFSLMTIWFQSHAIGSETVQTENFPGRLAGAGWAVWFYLGKALLPVNLSMIYPRWEIAATAVSLLPLLLLAAGFVVCWWFRRGRRRAALFALGCFTVTLFPVLGFFDMYFMVFSRVSDHFQYLPLICIVALVAATLHTALPEKILHWVAVALIAALGLLTVQRARVFATDEGLWADTLARNPAAWSAHNNLGCIRAEQGQWDEALHHFETSLKLNPRNTKALVNLGKFRAVEKKFAEAEAHFRAALIIKADDADAHAQYGLMLAGIGRNEEAAAHLREAVRLRPEIGTRLELAAVYRAAGKIREAIEQCRQALRAKPDQPEALSNLAWLLATAADERLRDGQEAVRCAERACALTGHQKAQMVAALAAAYAEAGRFNKAVATAQQAVELARAAGNLPFAVANEQLLRLYASGQPYHEPPPKQNQ
ncbi:MAG: tetratricopeptide repeat protein [Verrucomicrobia bacterium]|nr:tetratricopeptide repeat protein [Verrucomicrobiota bacterium]